ncbi:MAG: hypothetical protein ABJF01_15190 [bacterium]
MRRTRLRTRLSGALRARRGVALFITMFFVFGIGALALSAIYLTANASLISKTYEKEDDLKYASEAALAIGKAELNFNPAALPNTSFVKLLNNKTLATADAQTINGITVNLYAGPTGSTSGQFGRFASLVAEARDANGTGFVRRLELTQESFAKYAYWSNSETNNGSTIVFANGDQLWGPVWSNDDLTINSSGATFHDAVGTAGDINGVSYGTFSKGYQTQQRPINLPSLSSLTGLSALATAGGMNLTAPSTGDETTVRRRIEFLGVDMDANGDSIGTNEGFFRVYTANGGGQIKWLRGDWPGSSSTLPAVSAVLNCGDWHVAPDGVSKFYPVAVHPQAWFILQVTASLGATAATTESGASVTTIMGHTGARCYLGGDPHLVAVARTTGLGYTLAQIQQGGTDKTFTPIDQYGSWLQYTTTPNAAITTARTLVGDARYLYPLYRGFNTATKGVIYVGGTVGISGVLRGDITLYTPNTVVILDDLRYANDPSGGLCVDILGIIAGDNVIVADNSLNAPQWIKVGGSPTVKSLDDTPDLYLHAVIMALGTSFQVENYDTGSSSDLNCSGIADGRGCLYLTGGLIQNNRGAVGRVSGTGYIKRYSYDRCAVVNPPPYFPTTGRFQDNRYYELDPVRFNPTKLFQSLTPGP